MNRPQAGRPRQQQGKCQCYSGWRGRGHQFGFLVPGALLVVLGRVLQCVGLFRARFVPVWVPVGLLFSVITFVVAGEGALGLVTSIPMAVGAIGLGYFARRRAVDDAEARPVSLRL